MKSRIDLLPSSFSLLLVGLLLSSGCTATYQTTKRSELQEMNGRGPVRALTVDSVLYTFVTFSFSETELSGRGTTTRNGQTSAFEGSLPFMNIAFIERTETSIWKGVWVFPMVAGIVPYFVKLGQDPPRFDITRPSHSCPYIYAFDGTEYKL